MLKSGVAPFRPPQKDVIGTNLTASPATWDTPWLRDDTAGLICNSISGLNCPCVSGLHR